MNQLNEGEEKEKWYFRKPSLVIGFLCVGPLILPLVWSNPRFSGKNKVTISIIVVILTLCLAALTFNSINSINNYYQESLKLNS